MTSSHSAKAAQRDGLGNPWSDSRGGPHVIPFPRAHHPGMMSGASQGGGVMRTRIQWAAAWFVWLVTIGLAGGTVWLAALNGRHFAGQSLPAVVDVAVAGA